VPPEPEGIVIFGDVIESSRAAGRAAAWLRGLARELDAVYRDVRLARFAFTQGDELQGLLRIDADPFAIVVRTALRPDALPMRWAIVAGPIDPGRGPAIERTGPAFVAAREGLARGRADRDDLVASSGDAETDTLLADLAPLLPVLLGELSPRQRELARLLLVDGLRRSEAADRLGVSRATVSVLAERGHARELERLERALATIFRAGVARRVGAVV
jgi:hypothetical protein